MLLNLLNETDGSVIFTDPFTALNMPLELNYFLKVIIGGILGLLIGIERSRRQKEAGKATHFVVGTASTLLTCISLWFKETEYGDGARVAAQIVTGIGFLGAGMIFFRRESLRGLTTAAGIWATAAIGMCVASGMLWLAIGTTLLIISVQILLHSKIGKRNTQHLLLLKLIYSDGLKRELMDYFGIHNFHRFKISVANEKITTESRAKNTNGDSLREPTGATDSEHEHKEQPHAKKYIAETVIYPIQNVTAEQIALFMSEHSDILSIERLEDL